MSYIIIYWTSISGSGGLGTRVVGGKLFGAVAQLF